ncbi:MAG: AEC family transporter [Alphaproteobacteria bacterium]|nr:AEC family transporter [Alphaproteobacteria bacterium]MBF0394588.1 AEC family transporter [Alphaproteobacteria bacterium]
MIVEIATIIGPILAIAAIGFSWRRLGGEFDPAFVARLVTTIGVPFLVFSTLTRLELDGATLMRMAGAAMACLLGFTLVAAVALKLAKLPLRGFLNPMVFPNAGNMGLPLCLFAFGPEGLALAVVYFVVFTIAHLTLGISLLMGSLSLGNLARMPVLYALAAAIAFMATGIRPPRWLASTAQLLGDMTIPLMLMALGVSLSALKAKSMRLAAGLAGLRLGIGLTVGLGVAWAFGLEGHSRGVVVLESAMPVAVFNYLFAQRWNQAPGEVAGAVLVSTLASFALLPVLLAFLL